MPYCMRRGPCCQGEVGSWRTTACIPVIRMSGITLVQQPILPFRHLHRSTGRKQVAHAPALQGCFPLIRMSGIMLAQRTARRCAASTGPLAGRRQPRICAASMCSTYTHVWNSARTATPSAARGTHHQVERKPTDLLPPHRMPSTYTHVWNHARTEDRSAARRLYRSAGRKATATHLRCKHVFHSYADSAE